MISRNEFRPGVYRYLANPGMRHILRLMALCRTLAVLFGIFNIVISMTSEHLAMVHRVELGAFFATITLCIWRGMDQAAFFRSVDDLLIYDGDKLTVERGGKRLGEFGSVSQKPHKGFSARFLPAPGGEQYICRGKSGTYYVDLRFLAETSSDKLD